MRRGLELTVFSLQKSNGATYVHKDLIAVVKKMEPLLMVSSDRSRGNGQEVK